MPPTQLTGNATRAMSTITEIARSQSACALISEDGQLQSQIWFKTLPINNIFCSRVIQLQLHTDSHDQDSVPSHGPSAEQGSASFIWGWFEIIILDGPDATEPKIKDSKPLIWRSHSNRVHSTEQAFSRHFGKVFDRRLDLLRELEVGDCIAVRVCTHTVGQTNNAREGRLVAKILSEDLFSHDSWTLTPANSPRMPIDMKFGLYSLDSTSDCDVRAVDTNLVSKIWFSTPALDQHVIANIQDIQLFTNARCHPSNNNVNAGSGSWSWFDIIILESASATKPLNKNGRALVWESHTIKSDAIEYGDQEGVVFRRDHDLLRSLEVGNVMAVRVCARFADWATYAREGRLVVRISNDSSQQKPPEVSSNQINWTDVEQWSAALQHRLYQFLDASTPATDPAALSVETNLLTRELRIDQTYGANERPLRLLCFDGGGVRGISSLYILRSIMQHIPGGSNVKPCDYFDMMAGTSTGGLIAIMLGRLKMSIDDCIQAYEDMAAKIFGAGGTSRLLMHGERYDDKKYEEAIKHIVETYGKPERNPDAPMLNPDDQGCKVFVLACRSDDLNNRVATHLRTYVNPRIEQSFAGYKIWQAARATSAAPTYFSGINLGGVEYVDGGLGFNNPVLLLMGEARVYYGVARPIGCLVTIGTGMIPNIRLPSSPNKDSWNPFHNIMPALGTIEPLYETLLASENAHLVAQSLISDDSIYYRFNFGVRRGDDWADKNITLDDHEHMRQFAKETEEYLENDKTQERLVQCATKLKYLDKPLQSQVSTPVSSPPSTSTAVSIRAVSVSAPIALEKVSDFETQKKKEKPGLPRRISNFVHRRLSSSARKQAVT